MAPGDDRERLRLTFNQAAGSYQRARPDYPRELFDDLIAVAGLVPGDRLLEIGCATGVRAEAGPAANAARQQVNGLGPPLPRPGGGARAMRQVPGKPVPPRAAGG